MFGLPSWAIKVFGVALLGIVIAGCGARLASIWYAPQVAGMKAQIAGTSAQAKAVKVAQSSITRSDTQAEINAQATIAQQTRVIIKKVPTYVSVDKSPPVGCVTNGMLRLHDAAVLGIDPADFSPPAATLDAACSTTSPSDFMAAVVANYASARENSEQLDALEDDIKARVEASSGAVAGE